MTSPTICTCGKNIATILLKTKPGHTKKARNLQYNTAHIGQNGVPRHPDFIPRDAIKFSQLENFAHEKTHTHTCLRPLVARWRQHSAVDQALGLVADSFFAMADGADGKKIPPGTTAILEGGAGTVETAPQGPYGWCAGSGGRTARPKSHQSPRLWDCETR